MGRPVAELQSSMSALEFAEWMAYTRIAPWGETRADLRAGIVASTIANINRAKKQKAYSPLDFMPRFEPPDRPSPEQLKDKLRRILG
jgi:hypothetical protein